MDVLTSPPHDIQNIGKYREHIKRENTNKEDIDDIAFAMSWNLFLSYIYEHNAWLPRRNERISYVGDSQWQFNASLDVDLFNLKACYEDYCIPYYEYLIQDESNQSESHSSSDGEESISESLMYLPVMEFPKISQLARFDLKDSRGKSMNLMMRAESAQICVSILIGVMARVHGLSYKENKNDPPFDFDHPLTYVLAEWFRKTLPPTDFDECDKNWREYTKNSFLADLDEFTDKKHKSKSWCEGDCELAKRSFEFYYAESKIFAYFVRHFAFQWLAVTPISIAEVEKEPLTVVKYSYTLTRNIFELNNEASDCRNKSNRIKSLLVDKFSFCGKKNRVRFVEYWNR